MGPNSYTVVHGSGQGFEQLTMAATGRDVSIRFDDNLHDLSLQGPLAVDYLEKHIPGVRQLPYMGHIAGDAVRQADHPVADRLHRRAWL